MLPLILHPTCFRWTVYMPQYLSSSHSTYLFIIISCVMHLVISFHLLETLVSKYTWIWSTIVLLLTLSVYLQEKLPTVQAFGCPRTIHLRSYDWVSRLPEHIQSQKEPKAHIKARGGAAHITFIAVNPFLILTCLRCSVKASLQSNNAPRCFILWVLFTISKHLFTVDVGVLTM